MTISSWKSFWFNMSRRPMPRFAALAFAVAAEQSAGLLASYSRTENCRLVIILICSDGSIRDRCERCWRCEWGTSALCENAVGGLRDEYILPFQSCLPLAATSDKSATTAHSLAAHICGKWQMANGDAFNYAGNVPKCGRHRLLFVYLRFNSSCAATANGNYVKHC